MSRTIKHAQRRNLFHNGERGHHNSLLREYYQTHTGVVKDWRGLINRRDYDSDRQKRDRSMITKLCRTRMNRDWKAEVKNQLSDN